MLKSPLLFCVSLAVASMIGSAQGSAQVDVYMETPTLNGPRSLPAQTKAAVLRDYLESWQNLSAALDQNRPDLLNSSFVGTAKDKLATTIQQQAVLGLRTRYKDRAHNIRIVFYSPEGLSIELIDNVTYNVEILDNNRIKTEQNVTSRYVILLTPAEVRWRVRVFQAESE